MAIESVALLLNEVGGILKSSPPGKKIPSNAMKVALARYSEQRRTRTTQIQKMAGMACRTQLLHEGPAAVEFQNLPNLTDGDWLFRAFMGFSNAPMLNDLPLSSRGDFYNEALASFWQRFKTGKYSNSELFGVT